MPGDNLDGNGLKVGYGNMALQARGVTVALLICTAGIIGSNLWAVNHAQREHRQLARKNDILACAILMNQAERDRFRENWKPGDWERKCAFVDPPEDK